MMRLYVTKSAFSLRSAADSRPFRLTGGTLRQFSRLRIRRNVSPAFAVRVISAGKNPMKIQITRVAAATATALFALLAIQPAAAQYGQDQQYNNQYQNNRNSQNNRDYEN